MPPFKQRPRPAAAEAVAKPRPGQFPPKPERTTARPSARLAPGPAPGQQTCQHPRHTQHNCCVSYSSFILNIVWGRSSMRGSVVCSSGATTRFHDSTTGKHLAVHIRGTTSRAKLCRNALRQLRHPCARAGSSRRHSQVQRWTRATLGPG